MSNTDSCQRCISLHSLALTLSLLLLAVLTSTPVQGKLMCWSSDCVNGSGWCIQTCNLTLQRSCLAQYRQNTAGENVASYFGCHSALCNTDQCDPTEGVASDFSCCCSGDLCNSIEGLTPDGDDLTAPPNTAEIPTLDPSDDILVCEVYNCGENPDNCYHGYQICPTNTNDTAFCYAEYKFNDATSQYHLSEKTCTTDSSNWCRENTNVCYVDTDGEYSVKFCCCDRDLCNHGVIFSDPDNVDMMIYDPCEDMDCHHSCIVHDGTAHCYCDFGHILSEDKMTCDDLNECDFNNGNCEVHCINDIGTGYHCGCPDNQKLSDDGVSCEETGLICHYLKCNDTGIGCDRGYTNDYCDQSSTDPALNADASRHHCQAVYKKNGNVYEPRLLSCFNSRNLNCLDDTKCVLEEVPGGFYHCCCKENYCNAQEIVVLPSNPTTSAVARPSVVVEPPVSVAPPLTATTSSSASSASPVSTNPAGSDGGISQSKLIFIVVVVLAVVLLIPVIAVAIGCISYMYCIGNRKDIFTINLPDSERQLNTPDLTFCNLSFIDKVGQGRFAAVWRAKNIEAEVAVKVFPNSQMSKDSWHRECEIYRTSELEHKYILSFRGSEERETELWIVTDYYALGSLHDLLKKQTLSLKQFCDLAESAAVGLAHLHDQRIVDGFTKKPSIAHRDLKSKNILIRNDFTCVISDFGLAVKFQNEETSSDAHGQVGTSRYMAPEVLEGAISFQREAYLRIDVYAFALILWELASRTNITNGSTKQYRPPFDEYAISSNPSIEEMRDVVVGQLKRPTIAKGFTTSADYDCLRDTIEESWDQDPEARLSAQCIAERIRTFKLSKFCSKDSGLTDTNSPTKLTYNSDSMDSQLAPTTPSLSSSRTMSPMTSKTCMLDSGTESIGVYPSQAFSNETVRLGNMSSNSSFLPFRDRNSANFDSSHNFGGSTVRCNHHPSNRAKYDIHSTETTV